MKRAAVTSRHERGAGGHCSPHASATVLPMRFPTATYGCGLPKEEFHTPGFSDELKRPHGARLPLQLLSSSPVMQSSSPLHSYRLGMQTPDLQWKALSLQPVRTQAEVIPAVCHWERSGQRQQFSGTMPV